MLQLRVLRAVGREGWGQSVGGASAARVRVMAGSSVLLKCCSRQSCWLAEAGAPPFALTLCAVHTPPAPHSCTGSACGSACCTGSDFCNTNSQKCCRSSQFACGGSCCDTGTHECDPVTNTCCESRSFLPVLFVYLFDFYGD